MKSFREFMEDKMNEAADSVPAIKLNSVSFSFPFTETFYEPGYAPELDRGERSDSGVAGTEESSGMFAGDITIPLEQKTVLDIRAKNQGRLGEEGVKDYLSNAGGDMAVELLDMKNADFAGTFKPNIDDMDSYPEGLYEALAEEVAKRVDNKIFEVINV